MKHAICAKEYNFDKELSMLFDPVIINNCKNIIFFKERLESFVKQNYIIVPPNTQYIVSYLKFFA
jgi:hypothetical protein